MFKAKRNSVPLPNAKAMSAALADLRDVQAKHDARILFMLFLDRAALIARQLKSLGMETDTSIDAMFASALDQAKQELKKTPTIYDPGAKLEGKPS